MILGVLSVDLAIFDAHSLKDKRRVIHGLKDRLKNSFNVSVAEVGGHKSHKHCRLAIAMVSNEARPLHSQFDKMVDSIRRCSGVSLVTYERELY